MTTLTYTSIGNREDLIDVITNISPVETPIFSSLKKVRATGKLHEWLTQSLAAAAINATVEGADAGAETFTPRVRLTNDCQINSKVIKISGTQEDTAKAGVRSEYAYQLELKLLEMVRDIEFSIVNGTGNAGTSAVAREVKGLEAFITTNVSGGVATATVPLTETLYNDNLQLIYDQGGVANYTYVAGFQKRQISGFAGKTTAGGTITLARNVAAADRRITAGVDVYFSDFGPVRIILNRWVDNDKVINVEHGRLAIAMFRKVRHFPIAKQGDSHKGQCVAEWTLEVRNELSNGIVQFLTVA